MPGGLYDPACSVDGYGLAAVDECDTLRALASIWRDDPGWQMKVPLVLLCVLMLLLIFASGPLVQFLTAVANGQF